MHTKREFLVLRGKFEKDLIKQYKLALQNIRAEMLRVAQQYARIGEVSKSDALLYARDKGLIDSINAQLTTLNQATMNIQKELQVELYKEGYFSSVYDVDKQTGFKFSVDNSSFSQINPAVIQGLVSDDAFLKASENLDNKTRLAIKTDINQGVLQGKSIPEIAKAVSESLGKATNSALFIARTETHRAVESGSLDAYSYAEDNGVQLTKQWVATKDDRTRPDHQEMDGQIADTEIDGEFYFTFPEGDVTLGPGLSGIPEEDINCRCTTVAVVSGYEPTTMRAGSDVTQYQNYQDWADDKVA